MSDALRFELQGFGIDVVVVEPGLVRTSFSEAAGAALRFTPTTPVYEAFHAEVERITRESYVKGSMAPLAGSPDDVAAVIAGALAAPRPRARYTVTRSATVLLALRRLLNDRLWDRFLARTYPVPR